MSQRRVAITGLGLVSPYGGDLSDFFSRLAAGESAIRHLLTDDLPRPLSIPFVSCSNFDPDAALGRPLASMMDRFSQLGMAATFAAWDDAGLPRQNPEPGTRDNWGVAWGTSLGGTADLRKRLPRTLAERPGTPLATRRRARHEQRGQRPTFRSSLASAASA